MDLVKVGGKGVIFTAHGSWANLVVEQVSVQINKIKQLLIEAEQDT